METYVELKVNGLTLRGMVHKPVGHAGAAGDTGHAKSPVVILYHGFTGTKIDSLFAFVRFARLLAQNGIGCVRFDFGGSGESDGEFRDVTFSREVEEGKAILQFVKQMDWVDAERIGLLGFSMGGAVAAQVAAACADDVHKICLWAPAGHMGKFAEECFAECETLPDGSIDLGGIALGLPFLEDLKGRDLYEGITAYKGPVCIIHGSNDVGAPVEYGRKYEELYGAQASFHLIEGADHLFSKLIWRDEVFGTSLKFFAD